MDDFNFEGTFPLVITPGSRVLDLQELSFTLQKNKAQLEQLLLKHGAILLRGFPVNCARHFYDVISALKLGNFVDYIGGDSPRDKVEKQVYTSTEAPPSFGIPLHQELSYIKHFPHHIYFFCQIEPQHHGETTIADARRVFASLDHDVIQKFKEKGLTYISHYYYQSKIMQWVNSLQRSHKSWIDVFETTSKDNVEQKCKANEFAWRWLARDWIEIKQTRPAVVKHPLTNDMVWFNQAHLYDFNPKLLGWKNYIAAKLFYLRPSTRLHEVTYADGSPIPRKDLYHILDVLQANTVAYPWQKGDVMILDNILAMHGRAPFRGPRRILTALTS